MPKKVSPAPKGKLHKDKKGSKSTSTPATPGNLQFRFSPATATELMQSFWDQVDAVNHNDSAQLRQQLIDLQPVLDKMKEYTAERLAFIEEISRPVVDMQKFLERHEARMEMLKKLWGE